MENHVDLQNQTPKLGEGDTLPPRRFSMELPQGLLASLAISPEAAEGGPIALVEDGDEIFIDVEAGRLDLLVSPEELERRRAGWKMPVRPEIPRGWLRLYAAAATSADRGAVMEL